MVHRYIYAIVLFLCVLDNARYIECASSVSWFYRGEAQANNTALTFNMGDTLALTCRFIKEIRDHNHFCFINKGTKTPTASATIDSSNFLKVTLGNVGSLIYSDLDGILPGFENFVVVKASVPYYSPKFFRNIGVPLLRPSDSGTYYCSFYEMDIGDSTTTSTVTTASAGTTASTAPTASTVSTSTTGTIGSTSTTGTTGSTSTTGTTGSTGSTTTAAPTSSTASAASTATTVSTASTASTVSTASTASTTSTSKTTTASTTTATPQQVINYSLFVSSGGLNIIVNTKSGQALSTRARSTQNLIYAGVIMSATKLLF